VLSERHGILESGGEVVMSVVDERESLTTLLDDLAKLQKVAETLSPDDERVRDLAAVVSHRLAAAPPMRASVAATLLGLSEPTIRAWARRGVLRVRSRKPRLLLDPASVLEIRRLVEDLRHAGQSGSLLDEVFNHLADEQLLAEPSLAESLGQMHRGEYVVRRPRPS
jgi:hypothetical protein